jgi:hypothetical protein
VDAHPQVEKGRKTRDLVAEKVEAAIRRRMGRPFNSEVESVELAPHLKKGIKTKDLVADKAGFGSHATRDDAARVVERGIQVRKLRNIGSRPRARGADRGRRRP